MIYAGALYIIGFILIVNSLFYIWRLKEIKGLLFGWTMVFLGLTSLSAGLYHSKHIIIVPYLMVIDFIFACFVIIFMGLLVRSLIEPHFKWKPVYWLFFAYPLVQFILFSSHLKLSHEQQLSIVQKLIAENKTAYFTTSVGFYVHGFSLLLVYAYTILNILIKFQWNKVLKKNRLKVAIGSNIMLLWVFYTLYLVFKYYISVIIPVDWDGADYVAFFFVTFLFILFFQLWPYYFKYGGVYFDTKTFKIEKYFNKYLDNVDMDGIQTSLNHLMDHEKMYKDEDISSASVAKALGISVHQLSTYLNQHLQQNFFEYISFYRIEEAKKIMIVEPEKNVIEICYAVGYNSPSVFYQAFKKFTGLAPKEWLRKNHSKVTKG